ncbi:glycosyltransferase family 9 protein [Sulfuricurvum sp.]|uniref:glycosyltransferase family 9 protein n=1 Tax=Sulfuricurvum sp. TaxID=2025608 RepID=UPI0019B1021E|nr:glycosyltransferase family 9 protein [Sulfuricurvum sp.]MBD3806134.1 glycosyltransferase family 9 protein [Sulfuricurvum sp.]
MGVPLHSRFRRKLKNFLNSILRQCFSNEPSKQPIASDAIRTILVIRINYRIGNILFTTPILKALEIEFTNATIDILVGAEYTIPLLRGFKNVQNIYDFSRTLLKHPRELIRHIRQLRSKHYDLVLNLNLGSASDRAATFLAKGTYKLGFDYPNEWSPLTHTVPPPNTIVHEAIKPLYLMQAFNKSPDQYPQRMDIGLDPMEKERGFHALRKQLLKQGKNLHPSDVIIGMFRDARFEKKIDPSWWNEWQIEMQRYFPDAVFVDILSPDVTKKLNDNVFEFMEKNLRQLGASLSQMSIFVCGDTGPMHLASASFVPTCALFKTTTPTLYGTLGDNDLSLEIAKLSVQETAALIQNHLHRILP